MKYNKFLIKFFLFVFGFFLLCFGFVMAEKVAWIMYPTTIFACYFIGSNLDIFMVDERVNKQ